MSTKVWNLLTPEEQKWIQEAADESAEYESVLWAKSDAESMAGLEAAGVTIIRPDKEPFRKAVEGVYENLKVAQPEIYAVVQAIREVQ